MNRGARAGDAVNGEQQFSRTSSRRRRARRIPIILVLALSWLQCTHAEDVPWQEVEMQGRKFFAKASSLTRLTIVPRVAADGRLTEAFSGHGITPKGPGVAHLQVLSKSPIGKSDLELYLDIPAPIALQKTRVRWTKKPEYSTFRFTLSGVARTDRKPATGEIEWRPQDWSHIAQKFRDYPERQAGLEITDHGALLYLLAIADLTHAGDSAEFFTFANRNIVRIDLSAVEQVNAKAKFALISKTTTQTIKEPRKALRVLVQAAAVAGPDEGQQQDIFGAMRGAIEITLDLSTRAPLALTGKIRLIGKFTMRLKSLKLAEPQEI